MKTSQDFKINSLETLKGKWLIAVAVSFVASLLGATNLNKFGININFDVKNKSGSIYMMDNELIALDKIFSPEFLTILTGIIGITLIIGLVMSVAYFILGSVVGVGYAKFRLNLVDNKEASFGNLFEFFPFFKTIVVAELLKTLYIFLCTLALFIPGIIASLNYEMTEFILAENPELTAKEALEKSKEMMYGNRWRFFKLQLSFLGWMILSVLTLRIGTLWLTPYSKTAEAAFYRDLKGIEHVDYYTF